MAGFRDLLGVVLHWWSAGTSTTITPPFRVVAVDAYTSGASQGDSFVAGQQAGQANG